MAECVITVRARKHTVFTSTEIVALTALGFWIFATRAWLIHTWGSPLPFWDQWDAEALGLYRPWLEGTFNFSQLFAPHNEHRIALTRVSSLLLFVLAGEWSPWWQMLLNGALHACTAVVLAGALMNGIESARARSGMLVVVAMCYALPAGWQNALWGFQSQVSFTNLLAAVAIAGLLRATPLRGTWWWAVAAGALAPLGNASGLLVFAAALIPAVLLAGMTSATRSPNRNWLPPLIVLVTGLAVATLHVDFPGHAPLHARSFTEFGAAFVHSLAWPWVNAPWAILLLWLPACAWTIVRVRRRRWDHTDLVALGFIMWTVLQAAAIAYTRGGGLLEHRPLSRYQDGLLFGSIAQAYAAIRLAVVSGRPGRVLLLAWAGVVAAGALTLTTTNLSLHLPYKRAQDSAGLQVVREYLQTGDSIALADPARPHPNPAILERALDDPLLRSMLPTELHNADAHRSPWPIRQAPLLASLAAVLLGAAAMRLGRSPSHRPDPTMAPPPRA